MPLSIGIVGLPNVGKSSLFQTLTKKQVDCSNYPFCTIDPNVGVVAVPDERLDRIAQLLKASQKIYTIIEFLDIAGLVKGAHQGEGLGNKFLSHIRETDAILYILRAFLDKNIVNVLATVDPLAEKEILDTELILKDIETLQKRTDDLQKEAKAGVKGAVKELEVLLKAKNFLEKGEILIEQGWDEEDNKILKNYQLLTLKPRFYLLNGKDEEVPPKVVENFQKNHWPFLIVDVRTELEAADFNLEERIALGLPPEGELDLVIKKSYELLDLITFFTTVKVGEIRAWPVKKGTKVPPAAGLIHSDFENKFIKAEVLNYKDLVEADGFHQAREKGFIRTEGKEYVVQDGDIIEIKHGS